MTMKKFIKLEHPEHGIWYFTNPTRAMKYINVQYYQFYSGLNREKRIKGWLIEEIEDENVPTKFINPEKSWK